MKKSAVVRLVRFTDAPIYTDNTQEGPNVAIRHTSRGMVALAFYQAYNATFDSMTITAVGHAKVDPISGRHFADKANYIGQREAFEELVGRYNFHECYVTEETPECLPLQ